MSGSTAPSPPGEPSDPGRRERILEKLGALWRLVPDWSLAWLIGNLVPPGLKASDAEVELELDRLLKLALLPEDTQLNLLRISGDLAPATADFGELPEPLVLSAGQEAPWSVLARLRST